MPESHKCENIELLHEEARQLNKNKLLDNKVDNNKVIKI